MGYAVLDAAIRFKLGRAPPSELLTDQTQWPNALAAEFKSVSDSLGGARPSLNWMAASDINLEAAILARFSGSERVYC
jgi:hypothetical protein